MPSGIPGTKDPVPPRTASGNIREWNSYGGVHGSNLTQKQVVVAELAEVASTAHSLVASEYAGITVAQMTAMRKKARETGGAPVRCLDTRPSRRRRHYDQCVTDSLVGLLLYAFSTEEPGAAGRLIKEFAKGNDKLQAKVVSMGGKMLADLDVLATLPTRDQALSMLLSVLVEPATRVARVLQAIADQQQAPADTQPEPEAA